MGDDELGEPAEPETIAKPDELLALHGVTTQMFTTLRRWFEVPASVSLDLAAIDSAVVELGEPRLIAAMAMRKLQALHLLSTPGVRTSTDVIVTIVQDLQRALVQAPSMRLKLQAATTDWDAALRGLESGDDADGAAAPASGDDADPEVDEFRALHALLLVAVDAVITASDGEIRYLV